VTLSFVDEMQVPTVIQSMLHLHECADLTPTESATEPLHSAADPAAAESTTEPLQSIVDALTETSCS
jgi:hypothetical protein